MTTPYAMTPSASANSLCAAWTSSHAPGTFTVLMLVKPSSSKCALPDSNNSSTSAAFHFDATIVIFLLTSICFDENVNPSLLIVQTP